MTTHSIRFLYNFSWAFEQAFGLSFGLRNSLHRHYVNRAKNINTVESVEEVNTDKIKLNNLGDKPLVFRKIAKNTESDKLWSLDYFENEFGQITQPTTDSKEYFFFKEKKSLSEIIQNVKSDNPSINLAFGDLVHQNPQLLNQLDENKWLDKSTFKKVMNKTWLIFITGLGRWTKIHSEFNSTLSLQVRGKKRWCMVSPQHTIVFHPMMERKMYINSSNVMKIDEIAELPRSLKIYDVTLDEGDVLYCPPFYWHFVDTKETSISVGFKWSSLKTFLKNPVLSFIILTSRNPSLLSKIFSNGKGGDFQPPQG